MLPSAFTYSIVDVFSVSWSVTFTKIDLPLPKTFVPSISVPLISMLVITGGISSTVRYTVVFTSRFALSFA